MTSLRLLVVVLARPYSDNAPHVETETNRANARGSIKRLAISERAIVAEILRVQVDAPIEYVWGKNIVDETMHSVAETNFRPDMNNDVGPQQVYSTAYNNPFN
ncbi:MAG: hypothetical protein BYD32DRAFT_436549 [Podila humilis]|nr:MAG: hypothetical protein BYD32DRAFT_436549 [Podila humilis]